MALADPSALEARLGRTLTTAEEARAEALLEDASGLVIGYTGQRFTAVVDDVMVIRSDNGIIVLPNGPVTSVTSVTALGFNGAPDIAVVGWTWDRLNTIVLADWASTVINLPEVFVDHMNEMTPTYAVVWSHGYAIVPADVVSVVCGMTLRTLTSPTMRGGVTSETVGPYSYRLDVADGGTVVRMTDEDRQVLARYRVTVAALRI
jgi:hypothetical protein